MITIKFLIMIIYYHGFTICANSVLRERAQNAPNTSDISQSARTELLSNGDAYYIVTQKDRIH